MTLVPNSGSSDGSSRPSAASRSYRGVLGMAVEHPEHHQHDPGLPDELALGVEDRLVVVVEAEDHPAPDLHARVLDAVDLLEHRAPRADVLELLGLAERRLVRALDADEDADDVGLDHQPHQLGVVGQVDRRLGEEGQRVTVPLLPGDRRRGGPA